MSDEIKDEQLEHEDVSKIENRNELIAFVLKYCLLYYKQIIAVIAIIGIIILLSSGYSCTYKSISISKTPVNIPSKQQ